MERRKQIRKDDRTAQQRQELVWAVVGTDTAMSRWGQAARGTSVVAWACRYYEITAAEQWARSRGDLRRVRVVDLRTWRPKAAHVHIYIWSRPGVERQVTP